MSTQVATTPVPANPPHPARKIAMTLFKWGLAAGLVGFLYWQNRETFAQIGKRQVLWQMMGVAILVRFLALLVTFCRWRLLIVGIGIPMSLREGFRLGILGEACNNIGPGAVGGDLVKVALLAKDHRKRTASILATVFLDRVLGMWALFVLGSLASLSPVGTKPGPEMQWAVYVLWCGAVGGLFGIGLMFAPAFTHSRLMHWMTTWRFVGRIVKELMDSVQLYQGKPQIVLGAAVLGIIGHFGYLSCFYFSALALHQGQNIPSFIDHVVGLPLPEAITAVAPTPGGIGVLEGSVGLVYKAHRKAVAPDSTDEQLQLAFSNGILTALGYRIATIVVGALGIIIYFTSRKEIQSAVQKVDVEPDSSA